MNQSQKILAVLAAISIASGIVFAVTPFTETITVPAAGAITWTNTIPYRGVQLVSLEVFSSLIDDNTITVTRVRSTRTNTVATIVVASAAAIYRETNYWWCFNGDKLVFTSGFGTNSSIELVGEQSD